MRVEMLKQAMKTAAEGRPEEEQFSSSAEESNSKENALDEYLAATGDAKSHTKGIISQLFAHGKSGDYQTRNRTLIEKVGHVIKK
jgi:hypothetical protein